jgi:hypothetical protein
MTLQAQCQSNKITFNMDWSFGGGQMEKVLLEGLVEQTRKTQSRETRLNVGADSSGLKKMDYVPIALSVTSAYHSAGGPVQNIITWRQIKGKAFSVSHRILTTPYKADRYIVITIALVSL